MDKTDRATVNGWLMVAGGIWMVVAPWANMTAFGNAWNDWVMGVVFFILGVTMLPRKPIAGWIALLGGIWLFIAGWIPDLRVLPDLAWNDVPVGAGAILVGLWAALQRRTPAATASSDIRRAA